MAAEDAKGNDKPTGFPMEDFEGPSSVWGGRPETLIPNLKTPKVPGKPLTIADTRSIITGRQKGTISVNTADNPHWNDILAFSADGSLIHFNGVDFYNDMNLSFVKKWHKGQTSYNICCYQRCCTKSEQAGDFQTLGYLTFKSTDGKHKIRIEHNAGMDAKGKNAGCCAGNFMYSPLCFSTGCCKSCYAQGAIDWKSTLSPETMQVYYDDTLVSSVDVQPGIKRGGRERMRSTTVKDAKGTEMFFMHEVDLPADDAQNGNMGDYKCCALSPCCCFEVCKPCCCPICLPVCGGFECPRPSCSCGPCTACCNAYCDVTCKCLSCTLSCTPCLFCMGICCSALKCCCTWPCRNTCIKCGIKENKEVLDRLEIKELPFSTSNHQAHRMLYPLSAKHGSDEVFGWAAYTHMDDPSQANRATLAVNPRKYRADQAPLEILGALPLLIDLARSSSGGRREDFTFSSRNFLDYFEPKATVHFWKDAEVLQSVVTNFGFKAPINPSSGDIAPKQHAMEYPNIDEEVSTLLGKRAKVMTEKGH